MTSVMRRMLPAVVAGALGLGGAGALASEPSIAELSKQIEELKAEVAKLQAQQSLSGAQVDATVEQLLRDADSRSELMSQEGFTAGYSQGKFLIQSADGDFVLNPNVQFQFRYIVNYREGGVPDKATDESDTETGFEVRRLKFALDGNLFTRDLTYKFQWAADRKEEGELELEDAWFRYALNETWALRGGQFKDPVHHEELVSSKRQLAVDRSLLNELLGGGQTDYVQGVAGIYTGGKNVPLRAEAAFTDGANSDNTNFEGGADFGVAGRVEWMAMGDNWKAYDDFSAMGNKSDLLVLGVGADLTQTGDQDTIFETADAQWEPQAVRGLAVYGALVGRYRDFGTVPAGAEDDAYDYGFLAQAGYMLNARWEIFGRYDLTKFDDDVLAADAEDELSEITAGVNYYFKGHAAKFTADVVWLPNGSPVDVDGIGILEQDTDDDQFVLRTQFQLLL